MNKQAQVFTPITMIFIVITFIMIWALFGAKFLNDSIDGALSIGNFTGLEAFLLSSLPLFIFIALIVAIIALGYYATQ
jgi:cation transport ATPase